MKSNVTLNKYVCRMWMFCRCEYYSLPASEPWSDGEPSSDSYSTRIGIIHRALATNSSLFCRFFRCRCCCCCWGCASSILHWRSSPRIVARANIVSKMCAASTKCVYCSSSIRFHSLLCRFCVFRYEGVQTFIAWTNSNNNITSATTTKTMTAATTLTNPKEWKKKAQNET